MSESKPREWLFYVDDMIGFVEKASTYTKDMDQDRFAAGGLNAFLKQCVQRIRTYPGAS